MTKSGNIAPDVQNVNTDPEKNLIYAVVVKGIAEQDPANITCYEGVTPEKRAANKYRIAQAAKRFIASLNLSNTSLTRLSPEDAHKRYHLLFQGRGRHPHPLKGISGSKKSATKKGPVKS